MYIKTTLKPGMNGTRALLREYGEQLDCVRCRGQDYSFLFIGVDHFWSSLLWQHWT